MSTNFSAILSTKASTVERPKPVPAGTYLCQITKHEFGESAKNKTPYCRYSFQPIAPGPDVELEDPTILQKAKFREDFWLTEDAMFRLTEFLMNVLNIEAGERSLAEMIPDAIGQQVNVTVKHVPNDKGDVFVRIDDFSTAA